MKIFKAFFLLATLALLFFILPNKILAKWTDGGGGGGGAGNCRDVSGTYTIPPGTTLNANIGSQSISLVCDPSNPAGSTTGYWVPQDSSIPWPPTLDPTKTHFDPAHPGCRDVLGQWIVDPNTDISDSLGNSIKCPSGDLIIRYLDTGGWVIYPAAATTTCDSSSSFLQCLAGVEKNTPLLGTIFYVRAPHGNGLVAQVVEVVLPLAIALGGFLSIIIIIISGIQFITSSGNPEAAAAARSRLMFAVIGFVILVLAFAALKIVDIFILGHSGVV